jgi:hypothetical protein
LIGPPFRSALIRILKHCSIIISEYALTIHFSGATQITSTNVGTHLGDNFDHVVSFTDSPTNQGAFNNYAAINAKWTDTTDFDNLRADGSGGNEVTSGTATSFGNTTHTSSANATTY